MTNSKSHHIFLVTSIIALIIASILMFITGSQSLTGNETVFHASQVVYDQTDIQAIAQVRSAAGFQLIFLALTEVALCLAGILGLRFANRKTKRTLPCLVFAGISLTTWIIEIFAWFNLDKLMNRYDIYSSHSEETIIAGVTILLGILIAYSVGAVKFKKETNVTAVF